ncbi:hypothetical protein AOLI_G00307100 [Acnodon oligacanthus]
MRNETVATEGGRKDLPKACTGTAVKRLKDGRAETAQAQGSSATGATEGAEARADAAKEAEGPGRAKETLIHLKQLEIQGSWNLRDQRQGAWNGGEQRSRRPAGPQCLVRRGGLLQYFLPGFVGCVEAPTSSRTANETREIPRREYEHSCVWIPHLPAPRIGWLVLASIACECGLPAPGGGRGRGLSECGWETRRRHRALERAASGGTRSSESPVSGERRDAARRAFHIRSVNPTCRQWRMAPVHSWRASLAPLHELR